MRPFIIEAEAAAAALRERQPNLGNSDMVLMQSTAVDSAWTLLYVSFEEGTCKRGGRIVDKSAVDADRRLTKAGKSLTGVNLCHVGRDGKMTGWLSR